MPAPCATLATGKSGIQPDEPAKVGEKIWRYHLELQLSVECEWLTCSTIWGRPATEPAAQMPQFIGSGAENERRMFTALPC